jgi:hypothetical protein
MRVPVLPAQLAGGRGFSMSNSKLEPEIELRMFLIPCSCGTTFSVPENYDLQGMTWRRFLKCPICDKRHDPKNRLLRINYQPGRYWSVDEC